MIFKIFAIYDQKAGAYLPPFVLPTDGMATRTFSDCVNKEDHQFHAHPADYTLFGLGEFDDESAAIIPYEVVKSYGTGVEFIDQPAPEI
ncbi:nonstructural protein [Microviridae sp.]|nr:nonstructural protein [Microviridae sp.]